MKKREVKMALLLAFLSYDVTYDTSNSARHGFWKSLFCHAARYLCTSFSFMLGCNFVLHQFPGFLVDDCGMGIFNIVLPNGSIVCHRFMGQEIWCISFLKQSIAHIFLVCENTINRTPMPPTSTSRSRSFLLSKNNSNAINGHTV